MQRVAAWCCICLPFALAACGGETKTVTTTTPAASSAPPATAPPSAATGASGASGASGATAATGAAAALSEGVLAGGDYKMTLREEDYTGVNAIIADDTEEVTMWSLEPECDGESCTLRMRRELEGGGFKSLVLEADPERPNAYNGTSTGESACAGIASGTRVKVRQRYAVKLNSPTDDGGRQVAAKADTYYTETISGRDCNGGDRGGRGTVSWRGARSGG